MENKNLGINFTTPAMKLNVEKKADYECIIFDIIAASRSKSQKGDLSEFIKHILSPQQISTLKKRDKKKMTGNPIDIKKLIN